jgi:hypothetical protein
MLALPAMITLVAAAVRPFLEHSGVQYMATPC